MAIRNAKTAARSNKRPAHKTASRKASSARRAPARPVRKEKPKVEIGAIRNKLTASEYFDKLCEITGLERRDVIKVMRAQEVIVLGALHPRGGFGQVTIPRVISITCKDVPAKRVPAQKAGQTKVNPFTGEEYVTEYKAAYTKPARVQIKGKCPKKVKDFALTGKL